MVRNYYVRRQLDSTHPPGRAIKVLEAGVQTSYVHSSIIASYCWRCHDEGDTRRYNNFNFARVCQTLHTHVVRWLRSLFRLVALYEYTTVDTYCERPLTKHKRKRDIRLFHASMQVATYYGFFPISKLWQLTKTHLQAVMDTTRCRIHMLVYREAVNRQMCPIVLVRVVVLAETSVNYNKVQTH